MPTETVHCMLLGSMLLQSMQVFSFKIRGAYNKMASLSPEQRERGVIASSAGNHAQGVAYAARHMVGQPIYKMAPFIKEMLSFIGQRAATDADDGSGDPNQHDIASQTC